MSKTFKTCAIFCFTTVWLLVVRMISGAINLSDNLSDWLFTFLVQIVGLCVVPLLAYKFWVKEDVVKGFSLNGKISPLFYLIAIGLGVTLHFVIRSFSVLWQGVAILLGYVPTNSVGTIYSSPEVFVLSLVCTAVLPGICEELTYRGLGSAMFGTVEDERLVVVCMGILFGLGHQFVLQTGYAFLAGMVLGYLILKTRSIFPGMIVHFLNNAFSVVSDWAEQKHNAYYLFEERINDVLFRSYGTVICVLVVSVAATLGLLFLVRKIAGERKRESGKATYYYPPATSQHIDDLFGRSLLNGGSVDVVAEHKTAWYEYAFLYASLAITTLTTIFTFIWGVMR